MESFKVTVHLTCLYMPLLFFDFLAWLFAVYTEAASRWQICCDLRTDPYTQHALQHRAVGWLCVSECDLPSGVEWGTGANTVSLLTLASPAECGTYATHSLWLWDVCAGIHTSLKWEMAVCVSVICTQRWFWDIKWVLGEFDVFVQWLLLKKYRSDCTEKIKYMKYSSFVQMVRV